MPAAEGCSSVWEFDDDEPPLLISEESALLIEASNLAACGLSKSDIDFKQNFRADGRLPASKCFCAIERHRSASSLFPSIGYRQSHKQLVDTCAAGKRLESGRGGIDTLSNKLLFKIIC